MVIIIKKFMLFKNWAKFQAGGLTQKFFKKSNKSLILLNLKCGLP